MAFLLDQDHDDCAGSVAPTVRDHQATKDHSSVLESALAKAHVHLPEGGVDRVREKVRLLQKDGPDKLLVISDFDMTLSRCTVNGKQGCTSFSVVETSPMMPADYREETIQLRKKYEPVENNKDLPLEVRVKAMEEWFAAAHQLLVEHKLSRHDITEMVANANIALRSGCEELFTLLEEKYIPLLIFSAGLLDTILETLKQHSTIRSNMRVVSNSMLFDDSGVACGFTEPVIHSYSKGKSPDQFAGLQDWIEGRHNLVLMGDSLGDPKMVGGLKKVDHVIKIGFLNHHADKLLSTYLELYDIVLTGDASMDVVNAVLRTILT